eukprot:Em0002g204a
MPKTIHPLLASEIPQEERKSVQISPSRVCIWQWEKEGVPSTLVTADHKEAAEDKQIVKEKKLPSIGFIWIFILFKNSTNDIIETCIP